MNAFTFDEPKNTENPSIGSPKPIFPETDSSLEEEFNFEAPVINIFKIEKIVRKRDMSLRRDVVNKCILRYLIKYFKKNFEQWAKEAAITAQIPHCFLSSQIENFQKSQDNVQQFFAQKLLSELKTKVLNKCKESGFFSDFIDSDSDLANRVLEFLSWAACHHLKPYNKMFSSKFLLKDSIIRIDQSSAIFLLKDITKNYKHPKLTTIFKNQTIHCLFTHFMGSQRASFLFKHESVEKRLIYEEAFRDFEKNFSMNKP